MVMGGDSRSKGCGFKSRHRILDGHFSHIFVVKICNVCLKRPKKNEKEAGVGPFLKHPILHKIKTDCAYPNGHFHFVLLCRASCPSQMKK